MRVRQHFEAAEVSKRTYGVTAVGMATRRSSAATIVVDKSSAASET